MDRSTKATLSTYNTWIQLSRLQKIYHFHSMKLRCATPDLTLIVDSVQQCQDLIFAMLPWKQWTTLLSQRGFRLRGVQS